VTIPIRTRGLTRTFSTRTGVRTAVAGIDLEVGEGEIFGLLGPNGAGKTTTIRMLTTLLKPTSGTATVAGLDVVKQAAGVRRVIGAALQETAVDPLMTGAELMVLQGTLHGLSRKAIHARTGDLLGRFGLDAVARDRVSGYSGGMRRRLDLALSVIHEPSVLFLDEPTIGIDPVSRLAVWDKIKALCAQGTTVLLTTQYLEEADRLCRRVAIIDGGKVVAGGLVEELKASIDVPTLFVGVPAGDVAKAKVILTGFGAARPAEEGLLAIGLPGGSARTAGVVRALDDAGVVIERLRLEPPSLDDVFAAVTGRVLEGAT
jgi:ABC-2 type transport system ATP-binding protein